METIQEILAVAKQNVIAIEEMRKKREKDDKKWNEMWKKADERWKKTEKTLRWMWVTQWEISEDVIYENFEIIMKKIGKKILKTTKNLIISWKAEFDIVWINWTEVFVVEVKTKLRESDVDIFTDKTLPKFRKYLPEYRDYKLYWVVWWRLIWEGIKDYAIKKWLYVIKESNKWRAKMMNEKGFEGKEFVS